MIKIISFDIGNTLIEETGKSKIVQIEEFIDIDRKQFITLYKEIFQTGEQDINKQIKKFLSSLMIEENYEQICEGILKIFDGKRKEQKYIPLQKIKILRRLKEKGLILIAVSNSCKYTNTADSYLKELNVFDKIFYSYEIGYSKPNKEIFKAIERYYNVKSEEILHIGDSVYSDYYASKLNGWNALLYDAKDKYIDNKIEKIRNLKEIEKYIQNVEQN